MMSLFYFFFNKKIIVVQPIIVGGPIYTFINTLGVAKRKNLSPQEFGFAVDAKYKQDTCIYM